MTKTGVMLSVGFALRTLTARMVRLGVTLILNFVLFVTVPALQGLLTRLNHQDVDASRQHRIVAEIVLPQKKREEKPKPQRIREVKSNMQPRSGPSEMHFKFTPDLGIEAGNGVAVDQHAAMDAVIFEEGEADQDAVPLSQPQPAYPDRARELGIEGEVVVVFVVDIDGAVVGIDIVSSPHPSLSRSVRDAIARLRFKPAMNKGVPVRMKMRQVIDFKLS